MAATVTATEVATGVSVALAGWAYSGGTVVSIWRVVGGVETLVTSVTLASGAATWVDPAVPPATTLLYRARRKFYPADTPVASAALTTAAVVVPRVKSLRGALTSTTLDGLSVRPTFGWGRGVSFHDVIGRDLPVWFADRARPERFALAAQTSSYAAANALESVLASEPVVSIVTPGERTSFRFVSVVGWAAVPFAERAYATAAGQPGEWIDWTIDCRTVGDPGAVYYGTP